MNSLSKPADNQTRSPPSQAGRFCYTQTAATNIHQVKISLSVISYAQVISRERKSFPGAEPNSLSRADPGSLLPLTGHLWAAPPPPSWESAQPQVGCKTGTGWGELYQSLPQLFTRAVYYSIFKDSVFHHSFYSLGQKSLITNCPLNFMRAGKGPA